MVFQLLATHLHTTAEEAKNHFAREHGATNWQIETAIPKLQTLRPTMTANLSDGTILCVEVSEKAFSPSLNSFVVECCAKGYPVKLYVALPDGHADSEFSKNLKDARQAGVGVVEIQDDECHVHTDAVSLSLFGARSIKVNQLPENRREAARQAQSTFRNGNPVKGCQSVCEEIEAISRAFAIEAKKLGFWKATPPLTKAEKRLSLQNGSWAQVLELLRSRLDYKALKPTCPLVTPALISKAQVLTDSRNKTSHKPADLAALIERDRKLRTLFEQSGDTLVDWINATKGIVV